MAIWVRRSSTGILYLLHVKVANFQGVLLNKITPRRDLVAHEDGEDVLDAGDVLELDLEQHAGLWVHRGLPELAGVHFAKTFVALEAAPFFADLQDRADQLARAGELGYLLLGFDLVRRAPQPDRDRRQPLQRAEIRRADELMRDLQTVGAPVRLRPARNLVGLMFLVRDNLKIHIGLGIGGRQGLLDAGDHLPESRRVPEEIAVKARFLDEGAQDPSLVLLAAEPREEPFVLDKLLEHRQQAAAGHVGLPA